MRKTLVLALSLALSLLSQTRRDGPREAYRDWKQSDPTLERDAAEGGASFAPRANRAAEKAAKYADARIALLRQMTGDYDLTFSWLEDAQIIDLPAAALKSPEEYLVAESAVVNRNIATFQADADKAVQPLRLALERERKALAELSSAYAERKKAVLADKEATAAAESARLKAIVQVRAVLASLDQSTEQTTLENAGWAEYYQKLAEGASKEVAPPAPPEPVAAPVTRAIPSLTGPRYSGAWVYPTSNRIYRGPPPEFVDLVVHEENGHATGTLFARFKLPRGSTDDAELRIDFSGEFKNRANQVFNLESADGVNGTIELMPGSAPNLLEVSFHAQGGSRKIREAGFVLVKK